MTQSAIKPIETRYAGCRFRSRLEARWAVFMDHLGVPWEYEPQGYDLGDGVFYLPDFLVYPREPSAFWFEVKGTVPTSEELDKAERLARGTHIPSFVYFRPPDHAVPTFTRMSIEEFHADELAWAWDNEIGWLQLPTGPPKWQLGLEPTAFRFDEAPAPHCRKPSSGCWWWTDCPFCHRVILKNCGQVGWCPSFGDDLPASAEPLYPRFGHATPRLIEAHVVARSARFEHGERG